MLCNMMKLLRANRHFEHGLLAVLAGLSALLIASCDTGLNGVTKDCPECPEMIDMPAGKFLMGTAEEDRLIDPRTGKPAKNDGPQHEVNLPAFQFGRTEVTVGQFAAFIEDTGHETVSECMEFSKPGGFTISDATRWSDTGFEQFDDSPVVCVSYYDAQAYADWLAKKTGQPYRLPTEAEWEYATRAGATGHYFWGDAVADGCDFANVRSSGAYTISKRQVKADELGFPCDDGYVHSSPAASFGANNFGLYDTQGNVWEWVQDCNHKNYEGAPTDGSAWREDDCQFGIIRGGSYLNLVERSTVTVRAGRPRSGAATNMGFRVAVGADNASARLEGVEVWVSRPQEPASRGERLFNENCAACHQNRDRFEGLYGKTEEALFTAIKNGGNNVMSMPAFGPRMTDGEIVEVSRYVIEQNGW